MTGKEKQDTILIVDDNNAARALLKGLFEEDYRVLVAKDGREAIQMLTQDYMSVAIILLDIHMPVMDGMATLKVLRQKKVLNRIPVVLMTSEGSSELEREGYDLGAVDIIRKPFDNHIVVRRVKNLIELYVYKNRLEKAVRQQTKRIEQMNDRFVEVMCSIIEQKEEESKEHVGNVRKYTTLLAKKLAEKKPEYGLNEHRIMLIAKGSVLHDIGKVALDDAVLKKTTTLTDTEMELMYSHTTKGSEIVQEMADIQDAEYFQVCYDICRYHHERYDGGGYPEGLKGDEIPIAAQLVGLADVYDRLTNDNARRRAYGNKEAMQMILDGECGEFSEVLLQCFKEIETDLS